MTAAATPGREELIHSVSHMLAGHSFTLITGGHHEEMASKIVDRIFDRLAAKPSSDPDAMNERRVKGDARLAALRRLAIVQRHRMAYGGGTVHVGWTCKTCGNDWDRSEPEKHKPACVAASTTGEPKR